MKKAIIYTLLLAAIVAAVACQPLAPILFNEPNGVYFSTPSDSVAYTFAKYPSRTVDTIKIPVTVLGSPATVDREINIESLTGNEVNAKQDIHYKLLPPYKMPANKVSTTIPVVVYRTGDLDSITATLKLAVMENSHFTSGISSKTSVKIKIGFLQKPATWGELNGIQWAGFSSNFGTWTKTKYKVILEALYDPIADTTVTEFPLSRFGAPSNYIQYLQLTKNYIRTKYPGNYSGTGATLRDPDANNALVLVGPANY